MFIDASKENIYTLNDNNPLQDDEKRSALELEMQGRIRGLERDIETLDKRTDTNDANMRYRTDDLKILQMVTTILRVIYYIILTIGLILYAYERWFEYYEDEADDEAFLFILVGTMLVVGPQYILDAIIYMYYVFEGMRSNTTD